MKSQIIRLRNIRYYKNSMVSLGQSEYAAARMKKREVADFYAHRTITKLSTK